MAIDTQNTQIYRSNPVKINVVFPVEVGRHTFHCNKPATVVIAGMKQKRVRPRRVKPSKKEVKSDGLTLQQREANSWEILAKAGIDISTLPLLRAVKLHTVAEDKDVRCALRVASVSKSPFCVEGGKTFLLPLFLSDLDAAVSELSDTNAKKDTKSAFVKAALDKVDQSKLVVKVIDTIRCNEPDKVEIAGEKQKCVPMQWAKEGKQDMKNDGFALQQRDANSWKVLA